MAIIARILGLSVVAGFLGGILGGRLGRSIFERPDLELSFATFGMACVGAIVGGVGAAIAGGAYEIVTHCDRKDGAREGVFSMQP